MSLLEDQNYINFDEFKHGKLLSDEVYLKNNREEIFNTYRVHPEHILFNLAINCIEKNDYIFALDYLNKSNYINETSHCNYYLALLYFSGIYDIKKYPSSVSLILAYKHINKAFNDIITTNNSEEIITLFLKIINNYKYFVDKDNNNYQDFISSINKLFENLTKINLSDKKIYEIRNSYIIDYIDVKEYSIIYNIFDDLFNNKIYDESVFINYNNYSQVIGDSVDNFVRFENKCKEYYNHIKPTKLDLPYNNKRIKLGYIGCDYYLGHPVGLFMKSIFNYHTNVDVYIYSLYNSSDSLINSIENKNITWRDVCNNSNEEIVNIIKNDKIDILIDQLMFSLNSSSRMEILAYKPAKDIISYMVASYSNLFNQYFITDKFLFNENDKYKNILNRNPISLKWGMHCIDYDHPIRNIPINKVRSNVIKIGITCDVGKISPLIFRIISTILKRNDNVIIFFRSKTFSNYNYKKYFYKILEKYDINVNKVNIDFIVDKYDFYNFYNYLDLLMNTSPYGGCTTLFEALYMSTPVVSLRGDTISDSYGESFLNHLNLNELLVNNEKEYIDKIEYLCKNSDKLYEYHSIIHERIKNHPMCKPEIFIKELENAYTNIYTCNTDNSDKKLEDNVNNRFFVLVTEYFKSDYDERDKEVLTCLQNNIESKLFKKIIVLCEKETPSINIDNNIDIIITNKRSTFKNVFEYVNKNCPNEIVVISNNDIYFDKTLLKLRSFNMKNKCLALLRYDVLEDDKISLFGKGRQTDSQDTWIIQTPINIPDDCDFYFGIPGCDGRICHLLSQYYEVLNPCYDIKSYHLHNSNIRNYKIKNIKEIEGKKLYLPPIRLIRNSVECIVDIICQENNGKLILKQNLINSDKINLKSDKERFKLILSNKMFYNLLNDSICIN